MNNIIYFVLIFLTTYTDSFLTPYMGAFGFSLLPTASLILYIWRFVLDKRTVKKNSFCFFFKCLINYTFMLSIALYLILLFSGQSTTFYGEDLLIKGIKLYVTFLSYIAFIFVLLDVIEKMSLEDIFKPFYLVNIFLAVFGLIEFNHLPHAFMNLHNGTSDVYYRVRLLCQESSHTAPIIELFFLMSAFYSIYVKKSKINLLITIICFIVQIYISSSKSFMVVLGLSLVFGMWKILKESRHKGLITIGSIGLILLFYKYVYFDLLEDFEGDISNSTSTSTRSTSVLSGYLMGILIPWGAGFGGYLYLLPQFMRFIMENLPSFFDTSELEYMIHSKDDSAIASQAFFSQSSTYWGCIGVCLFLSKLLGVFKKFLLCLDNGGSKALFKTICCVLMLNMSFTTGLDFVYLSVLAIMINFNLKQKHIQC